MLKIATLPFFFLQEKHEKVQISKLKDGKNIEVDDATKKKSVAENKTNRKKMQPG